MRSQRARGSWAVVRVERLSVVQRRQGDGGWLRRVIDLGGGMAPGGCIRVMGGQDTSRGDEQG